MFALAASGILYSYNCWFKCVDISPMGRTNSFGIVFIWIGVRLSFGVGPSNPGHVWWEKIPATLVKITLYILLVAYIITGYVTASGLKSTELLFPINVAFARSDLGDLFMEAHFALKWILLAVLALHLLGTLKHSFIDRDNTFRNMWIIKKG